MTTANKGQLSLFALSVTAVTALPEGEPRIRKRFLKSPLPGGRGEAFYLA
jgi:hypothetical protein